MLLAMVALNIVITFGGKDAAIIKTTSEDIRMMVNVLAGISGDAVVKYPQDLAGYKLELTSASISITADASPHYTFFSLPDKFIAKGKIENTKEVCLFKNKREIVLSGCANG